MHECGAPGTGKVTLISMTLCLSLQCFFRGSTCPCVLALRLHCTTTDQSALVYHDTRFFVGAMVQDPEVFSQGRQMKRADLRLPAQTPALFLDCKDPVDLMVAFSGGPLPPSSTPAALVRCGFL